MIREELLAYKGWKKELIKVNRDIYVLEYDMEGVKGVDLTHQGGSTNPEAKINRYHDQSEKLEKLKKERERILANIKHVDSILEIIDDRDMVEEVLINHRSYERVAAQKYISISGLYKRINKAIAKIEKGKIFTI